CAPRLHSLRSLFSLFFQSSVAHRDLHSFPTRRSSDLQVDGDAARERGREVGGGTGDRWRQQDAEPLLAGPWRAQRVRQRQRAMRSEEHTSELQSRGHLVCRLLLEKKKKKKTKEYKSNE